MGFFSRFFKIRPINFKFGTQLAVQQDILIDNYKKGVIPDRATIQEMESNAWVALAAKIAPNNLVIRQYCLIDLFKKEPGHQLEIRRLLNLLSYKGLSNGPIILAEGYSYWKYIKNILNEWQKSFNAVGDIIDRIDQGFLKTSYKRGDVWYPAPFGDLRDEPLEDSLQQDHKIEATIIGIVRVETSEPLRYIFEGRPIGFNLHVPKNVSIVTIVNGIPQPFKFYEGYNKKYRNSFEEILDTIDPKRMASIP
jgi:hypothetical protein